MRAVARRRDMFESSNHPVISRRPTLRFLRALCSCAVILLAHLPAARAQSPDHSTETLRKLNESVAALIKRVSPSVVQILVTGYGPLEEGEHESTASFIGRQRAIAPRFGIHSL